MSFSVKLEGSVTEDFIVYKTVRVPNDDGTFSRFLPVECPRRECGGEFLVTLNWKKLRRYTNKSTGETTVFITKSCPYCFMVSRIPRMYWPTFIKEKYDKTHDQWHKYFKTTGRRGLKL